MFLSLISEKELSTQDIPISLCIILQFFAQIQALLNINYNSRSIAFLQKEELVMCEKVIFNVIEKNKYENIDDITKCINNIVNKLIVNEFAKSIN